MMQVENETQSIHKSLVCSGLRNNMLLDRIHSKVESFICIEAI